MANITYPEEQLGRPQAEYPYGDRPETAEPHKHMRLVNELHLLSEAVDTLIALKEQIAGQDAKQMDPRVMAGRDFVSLAETLGTAPQALANQRERLHQTIHELRELLF